MLVKLMKHEFRATFRTYLTINVGVILLSILLGLSMNVGNDFIIGLMTLGWVGFLIAAPIICIVQCAKIFTRDLFGPVGYLNLTLPVKTSLLLFSKFAVLILWTIFTYFMMFVGFFAFIIIAVPDALTNLDLLLDELGKLLMTWDIPLEVYVVVIINSLVSLISTMMLIGLSATIVRLGNLTKGHSLISIIAFFGISYIVSFAQDSFLNFFSNGASYTIYDLIYRTYNYGVALDVILLSNWISIALQILTAVLSFIGTVYLIDNKIEIQ